MKILLRTMRSPTAILLTLLILGACALEVPRVATDFSASPPTGEVLFTTLPIVIDIGNGYTRNIPQGMELRAVGGIPQGAVYKPTNQTLTLEGKHIHEVYVVVQAKKIVGFFMPVERAYVALPKNIDPGFITKGGV